jgi:hypothetical protein
MTCRLDHKKNRKVFDWHVHHNNYIGQWEMFDENMDENDESHTNKEYK